MAAQVQMFCSLVFTNICICLWRIRVLSNNLHANENSLRNQYAFSAALSHSHSSSLTRPRSLGRELVPCAAFAMNARFEIFVCVSPGIFQATRPRSLGRELVPCAAFAINFRFGVFECVSPGICEAARSTPQVRNSYRVGWRVYAPKIPVFSVNKFRTPLGVFRPVAIKYRTPLRISGTWFPWTAGNIEHEALHVMSARDARISIFVSVFQFYSPLASTSRKARLLSRKTRPSLFPNVTWLALPLRKSSGPKSAEVCLLRV